MKFLIYLLLFSLSSIIAMPLSIPVIEDISIILKKSSKFSTGNTLLIIMIDISNKKFIREYLLNIFWAVILSLFF